MSFSYVVTNGSVLILFLFILILLPDSTSRFSMRVSITSIEEDLSVFSIILFGSWPLQDISILPEGITSGCEGSKLTLKSLTWTLLLSKLDSASRSSSGVSITITESLLFTFSTMISGI